tara:strand:+ start:308 stop:1444 length:1137 start_codon:yes stop_codon:yes gene_type:complete
MTTIRMSRERKNDLQILKATRHRARIASVICDAFTEAHQDVKHESDKRYSHGGHIIDVADGLIATSLQNGRLNVHKEYVYKKVKEGSWYKPNQRYTTQQTTNPVVSEDGEEPVRYQYEWQPYVVAGIQKYLRDAFESIAERSDCYNISNCMTTIEGMIAWIELEKKLPTGFQVVSKKRSPRTNGDFIVRSQSKHKGSDYNYYTSLGLEYTQELINTVDLMRLSFDIMKAHHNAAMNYNRISSDARYAERDLESYERQLDRYKDELKALEEKVGGDFDAAIAKDDAERLEINEYLSNVPNSHLLYDKVPSPKWLEQSLAIRVQRLLNEIESYTKRVKNKKLAIKKGKSSIPKLEYELSLKKMEEFTELYGLSVEDGEEE